MPLRFWFCLAIVLHLSVMARPAQAEPRLDTPSGFPVPRWVSLKAGETNCRLGPSFEHPVRYVFKRAGAPVLVVAESVDHWRKIQDSEGDECWAHRTTLKAQTHVLLTTPADLRRRPTTEADVTAHLQAGVLAAIKKRGDGWIRVEAGDSAGWISAAAVWGGVAPASPDEAD